jgi:hypothetical protein
MTTWKEHERRTARRFNGQRISDPGRSSPDVIDGTGYLLIECKHRDQLPAWLTSALSKVRGHCEPDQTGVVVLHEKGRHSDNDLVLMAVLDFEKLWG